MTTVQNGSPLGFFLPIFTRLIQHAAYGMDKDRLYADKNPNNIFLLFYNDGRVMLISFSFFCSL